MSRHEERMTAGQFRRALEIMPRPCPAAVLYGLETRITIEQLVTLTWKEASRLRRQGGLGEFPTHILESQLIHIASPYVFWFEMNGKPMPLFGLDAVIFESFNMVWGELLVAYNRMIWIDDSNDVTDFFYKLDLTLNSRVG